jgi:hypothetical protein
LLGLNAHNKRKVGDARPTDENWFTCAQETLSGSGMMKTSNPCLRANIASDELSA